MYLGDCILAERRDVSSGHDGVVEAGLAREAFGEHSLTSAGRTVQEQVTEGRLVELGVDGAGGHAAEATLEGGRQHEALHGAVSRGG